MTTLLVVALAAGLLRVVWRRRRAARRVDSPPEADGAHEATGTPRRRLRAVVMVMALLGLQLVATAPSASAESCGEAPNPERPGSGMVGALDPAQGQGEAGSAYVDYGYAGMVWNVFETDCGPMSGITDPSSTIDTWAGNQLFNVGKTIVGATNSLHYTVMEGGLLTPLYDAVKSGAEKVYNNIYAQLFGLVALLLAIMMFRSIWRGDLPAVSKRALLALAGMWLAASSLAMLRYYDDIDRAIVQTTTNIQAGFVDDSENRVVRHVLPTNLHNEVVYNNWLRGEFGAVDATQAEEFGRPLLDAQAFTWGQIRNGDDAKQEVVDGKKNEYKNIATQLGPATGYFTGEDGSRTGAGFLSFGQSVVYSLFQLLAKAAVLLAQVLIRLFTLTAPLIGLVAMLHHDILRRVAKVAAAVAFNLVVLSVLAGVHAMLLQAIFNASGTLSILTQMVIAGLVTALLFLVGRPTRRLWQMVEMSVSMVGSAVPSPRGGLLGRVRRRSAAPTPQDEFWQNVRDTDDEPDQTQERGPVASVVGGRRIRPEASAPVTATAQRMDTGSPARDQPAAAASASWAGQRAVGDDGRAALPPAGGPRATVFPADGAARDAAHMPAAAHGAYGVVPGGAAGPHDGDVGAAGRAPGRPDDPDPFVVPSRMGSTGVAADGAYPSASDPAESYASVGRRSDAAGHSDGGYTEPVRHRTTSHTAQSHARSPASPTTSPAPATTDAARSTAASGTTSATQRSGARRAGSEVVAGKPVFVLYRPSRGLEVREDLRDTDSAMR